MGRDWLYTLAWLSKFISVLPKVRTRTESDGMKGEAKCLQLLYIICMFKWPKNASGDFFPIQNYVEHEVNLYKQLITFISKRD